MADAVTSFTETIQSGAVATGSGTFFNCGGLSVLAAQVSGITSATISWEGTTNESDWVAITGVNLSTLVTGTTATANGIYTLPVAGLSQVRARISTYATGTITVRVKALQFGEAPVSIQSLALPDEGQQVMDDSISVAIASDQTAVPTQGGVAHDAADSGSPVKIGGKASSTLPTAVSSADRVDALYDPYGRQVVRQGTPLQTITRAGVSSTDGSQVNSTAVNVTGNYLYAELSVAVTGTPGSVDARAAIEGSLDGTYWTQIVRFVDCTDDTLETRVVRIGGGVTGTEKVVGLSDLSAANASNAIINDGPLPLKLRLVTSVETLSGGTAPTVSYTLNVSVQ